MLLLMLLLRMTTTMTLLPAAVSDAAITSSAGEALAGWLQTFQPKLFRRLRKTF
jgi:hypothetical protein